MKIKVTSQPLTFKFMQNLKTPVSTLTFDPIKTT